MYDTIDIHLNIVYVPLQPEPFTILLLKIYHNKAVVYLQRGKQTIQIVVLRHVLMKPDQKHYTINTLSASFKMKTNS